MVDQHAKFSPRGLKTDFVGEAQSDEGAEKRVLRGESQLVYISPENLINNTSYRRMLLRQAYKDNLVAMVIDEAHCIQTWGDEFRMAFAEIGNLRSIIPQQVNIMALTATATQETLKTIIQRLSLRNPKIIAMSPQRINIFLRIDPAVAVDELATKLTEEFIEERVHFPKTVIFCRRHHDCSNLYLILREKLGNEITEPTGYPDLSEFRMVELYTRVSTPAKREAIIERFCAVNSTLRLVIATIAFGMGIDCQDIRRIIHWGLPSCVEEYVQETGRAGRDGGDAVAILYEGKQGHYASEGMKAYVNNKDTCRRQLLFHDFLCFSGTELRTALCTCCDVCASCCICPKCRPTTMS